MSDMWKAYVTIVMRGKHKGKVYSLVNNRGRRYQHRMKSTRVIAKTMVAGYLNECLWRSWLLWYFREKASKADYFHGHTIPIRKGYPV
ncbi:hypothetical protein PR001_g18260 [Phytophthora rubi]|uniref:Uncharacterized protein n=2 Tax=Phytophthora rubi TaxID=129364 RepID=A0A6A3KA17_9STRA|nr:hypothetical protein PR002_g18621 [Phytophthora rubi]KAE9002397.1 hypothetical protein PR001_g18260 [Phytophthora rubi]